MDPDACFADIFWSLKDGDWECLKERSQALINWLEKDGFPPKNWTKERCLRHCADTLRFAEQHLNLTK